MSPSYQVRVPWASWCHRLLPEEFWADRLPRLDRGAPGELAAASPCPNGVKILWRGQDVKGLASYREGMAQMRALWLFVALVGALFLFGLTAAAWNHFEMYKVTPW